MAKHSPLRFRAPRRNKFGAQVVEIGVRRFDSKKEGRRYVDLKLLVKAGEITDLECQVKFPLKIWVDLDSKHIGNYIADFRYYDVARECMVVEDVKGVRTPLYRWKKKHFEAQYGMEILET